MSNYYKLPFPIDHIYGENQEHVKYYYLKESTSTNKTRQVCLLKDMENTNDILEITLSVEPKESIYTTYVAVNYPEYKDLIDQLSDMGVLLFYRSAFEDKQDKYHTMCIFENYVLNKLN